MVGNDFTFNNKTLSDFGLVMVGYGEDDWALNREIYSGTSTPHKVITNHYGTNYTGTVVLNFLFIPDLCKDKINIDYNTLRMVTSWLTSPKKPIPLYIDYNGEVNHIYDGIWSSVIPSEYNGLTGIVATFTTNSPYPYSYRHVKINSSEDSHVFFCDSDELEEIINPKIIIKPKSTGDYIIKDLENDTEFKFTLTTLPLKVVFDCRFKTIKMDSKAVNLVDLGIGEEILDFNNISTGTFKINWPVIYPGFNKWQLIGDGEMEIIYKNPIKVGGYTDV